MHSYQNEHSLLPLLFAEVPEFFKANITTKKITNSLCRKYAKQFERRLGVPVSWHYTPQYNVEFLLTNCKETLENHDFYMEEIIRHCLVHRYIFSYIGICNIRGKITTMINRNHSVEWPAKRPH